MGKLGRRDSLERDRLSTLPCSRLVRGECGEQGAPSSGPDGITKGPDGNLWFTEDSASANQIERITSKGKIAEYSIPTSGGSPFGITAVPDGNLWFTEQTGSGADEIGSITCIAIQDSTFFTCGVGTTTPCPCPDGEFCAFGGFCAMPC